jgi:hypothetical protein
MVGMFVMMLLLCWARKYGINKINCVAADEVCDKLLELINPVMNAGRDFGFSWRWGATNICARQ